MHNNNKLRTALQNIVLKRYNTELEPIYLNHGVKLLTESNKAVSDNLLYSLADCLHAIQSQKLTCTGNKPQAYVALDSYKATIYISYHAHVKYAKANSNIRDIFYHFLTKKHFKHIIAGWNPMTKQVVYTANYKGYFDMPTLEGVSSLPKNEKSFEEIYGCIIYVEYNDGRQHSYIVTLDQMLDRAGLNFSNGKLSKIQSFATAGSIAMYVGKSRALTREAMLGKQALMIVLLKHYDSYLPDDLAQYDEDSDYPPENNSPVHNQGIQFAEEDEEDTSEKNCNDEHFLNFVQKIKPTVCNTDTELNKLGQTIKIFIDKNNITDDQRLTLKELFKEKKQTL